MSRLPAAPTAVRLIRAFATAALGAIVAGATALLATTPADAASAGSLRLSSGKSAYATITTKATKSTLARSFTVPATDARPAYLGMQFRSVKVSNGYRTRAAIAPDGSVRLGISRVVKGKEKVLLSENIELSVEPGDTLNVEGAVSGTKPVTIKVRAWLGGTKPDWQKTYSDQAASRITRGKTVRAWGFLDSRSRAATASVAYRPVSATLPAVTPSTSTTADTSTGSTAVSTLSNRVTDTSSAPVKPNAASTGPTSSILTRHDGNIIVTRPGTIVEGLDVHGFITVRAADVTIRNSIVRGGPVSYNHGLITNYGYDNLLVEDVLVKPSTPSVWVDGVKGWDFTLNRVHVVGGVDNVKIHGDNVTITNSLLESTDFFTSDPNQRGGATHNDNVQILKGERLVLTNNTIRDATNFAIMDGAEQGNVTLTVSGNWLDGGHCTVKMMNKLNWTQTTILSGNHFGPNRKIAKCVVQAHTNVDVTAEGNDFEDTGKAVSILWNNA